MKKIRNKELRWRMTQMLIIGWLLPLMLLSISMALLVSSKNSKQLEETIRVSTRKAVEMCTTKLEDTITASRNASYMPAIKNSYQVYLKEGNSRQLYTEVTQFLNQQYKYNDMIRSVMLYFVEQPELIYYTYSNVAGATYSSVWDFMTKDQGAIQQEAASLGTSIRFVNNNGKLYLIRNMVTSNYEPFAVIVMEVNTMTLFEQLRSVVWYVESAVYVGDTVLLDERGDGGVLNSGNFEKPSSNNSPTYDRKDKTVVMSNKIEGQELTYYIRLDKEAIVNESDMIVYLFVIFLLFMIPLISIIFYFFYTNVNKPIGELVRAAKEIEKGNFDLCIREISENEEFQYLGESFNQMCAKLQQLFQRIYLEEIALRDANIRALQAQINPHFLNNTLEIINWEARLSDNDKVSQMIEALSIMMEATMNRKKESLIPLVEELGYVDAYLYIISCRFGSQFEFIKQIDDTLLEVKVPRLIIQPIMENAVEYGVDEEGRRRVVLSVYQEGEQIVIEVRNNGILTKEDEMKIDRLLNERVEEQDHQSLNLGIYNVNKRVKIIYGSKGGLTIRNSEEGETISTIFITRQTLLQ